MAIKAYKPVTNGRRNMTTLVKTDLSNKRPEKSLTVKLQKKSGKEQDQQFLMIVMHVLKKS